MMCLSAVIDPNEIGEIGEIGGDKMKWCVNGIFIRLYSYITNSQIK